MKRLHFALAALLAGFATMPAYAANTRTWISGTGVDQANCGAVASPCRTLQYAHDNTSAGGEIDVKDSAGYGSIAITKAMSIVGDGSLVGVLASSGGSAITINAGTTDTIVLRGLTIEGAGVGANGILFKTAGLPDDLQQHHSFGHRRWRFLQPQRRQQSFHFEHDRGR